jgi:hypothetical protein
MTVSIPLPTSPLKGEEQFPPLMPFGYFKGRARVGMGS